MFLIHADGDRGVRVFTFVCLYVCFPHNMPETDAARITKLDTEMLGPNTVYFGSRRNVCMFTIRYDTIYLRALKS